MTSHITRPLLNRLTLPIRLDLWASTQPNLGSTPVELLRFQWDLLEYCLIPPVNGARVAVLGIEIFALR